MPRSSGKNQMIDIADSFRWLLKDKLISMDNVTRAMIGEMKTVSVKSDLIAEFLPQFFRELVDEVVTEQTDRYDKKGA